METEERRRGKDAAALSGGHLCHVCGYQYPNPHPSAKLRRSHRKHCGKASPPAAAAAAGGAVVEVDEREEEEASGERNAGVGVWPGRGGGGGGGEREGSGASEVDGGSALRGSAEEAGESVEGKVNAGHASPNVTRVQIITSESSGNGMIDCIDSENASPDDTGVHVMTRDFSENGLVDCTSGSIESVKEGNGTEILISCSDGRQNKVDKYCSGIAPVAAVHPAEREDSLDEYQDASPFLQSDSEDGAVPTSGFSIEVNHSNTVSSGSSAAPNETTLETNGLCKDEVSGEPSMPELSADSEVGYNLENGTLRSAGPYECPVKVDNNYTDVADSKSVKTSVDCELIGASNASSFQESCPLIVDPELQSTCSRKVEGFMAEEAIPEIIKSDNAVPETTTISSTSSVLTGNSKVVQTENTSTDCSMGLPGQNSPVKDTPDFQLPIENACQKSLIYASDGFQNDLPVTNADDTVNYIAEDGCSDLDFTIEERPQPDTVKKIVHISGENTATQKTNGFVEEEVCNKQINHVVHMEGQFSASQKHTTVLVDQNYSSKNPFILDDAKNDDLFELPADSCYLELPNGVVSKQEADSTSLTVDQPTVSNQTWVAEGQQYLLSNGCMVSASSARENGHPVGLEYVPESSAELVKSTCLTDGPVDHGPQEDEAHTNGNCLTDGPVDHGLQEDEAHTNGVSSMSPQAVTSMEYSKISNEDTSVLGTDAEENMKTEDTAGKGMSAVQSTVNIQKKQADDIIPKDTHADNLEENKLTEDTAADMNAVQHADDVINKQAGEVDTEEASEGWSIGNVEEKKQAECGAKEMDAEFTAVQRQTDETSAEEMNTPRDTDHFEQKILAQGASAKEMNASEKVEDKNQANGKVGQERTKQNEEIAVSTGARLNSGRIHVPLKVLLAEASVENKVKKTSSAKERVLSFRRLLSKDDNPSAKSGSPKDGSGEHYWNSPARLPRKDVDKRSKGRKQPWMPFICCHSVH
ncbi:hypothetical protein ACP4OV_024268 [Aristida adscensionis]